MDYKAFTQSWIGNMINSLDANVDEETKTKLMEDCGRACARREVVKAANACKGDLERFLTTFAGWVGKNNVRRDGDVVHVVYTKCLCHLVQNGPPRLPDTYCLCSRGWLMEMFETVVEHPVDVTLLESIKRGGRQCRFTVKL